MRKQRKINAPVRTFSKSLLLLAFLAPTILCARAVDLSNHDSVDLAPWVEYLRETPEIAQLAPENINQLAGWQESPDHGLDFGFTDDAYWFRAAVHPRNPGHYVLMVDAACADLKVVTLNAEGSRTYNLNLDSRGGPDAIRHRRPATEMELPAGDTVILLRLKNEQVLRMPPVIFTARAFYDFRTVEAVVYGAFFGAIVAISLYNFFVYLSMRERAYGIYVFYALMAGAYTAAFQGFHIALFPDAGRYWLLRSTPIFTSLVGFGMNLFAYSFLQMRRHTPRMGIVHLVLAAIAFLLCVAAFLPFVKLSLVLRGIAVAAGVSVSAMFVSGLLVWSRGFAPARYYVLAISLFTLAAMASSLRLIGIIKHSFWIQHGVQAALLAEMILLSLALSDRINLMKVTLEKNLGELAIAHDLVATSEKKYRVLVEDTSDLIFAMDQEGMILSINHAAQRILGYEPRAMAGRSIFSFIFEGGAESQSYDVMIFRDQFEKLGESVLQTRLRFASRHGEPVDLVVRLERIGAIGADSETVVLGKASRHLEDVLLPAILSERGRYSIENFFSFSELVHQRLTRSLGRYFGAETSDDIGLVLREMLINAIEHGNLEITYDEKTKAQAQGKYMDLIRERQQLLPYRERHVLVEYSLNHRRVWFRITDEGPGFDHRAMQAKEEERLRDLSQSHGRGIGLARALFDIVRYNESGNSIVLAKFTKETSK